MKKEYTNRGFGIYHFRDHNDKECTIQKSSLAFMDAIWLGAKDIGLKEFLAGRKPSAWQDVVLADTIKHHYVANNRMHLTREQVRELLPVLQKFVETGKI